jgi:GNAT superfamily N-acetyltransferase
MPEPERSCSSGRQSPELLIRPAAASEAAQLTALVMRSKAYWGYTAEFLRQAAPELTVSEQDIAEGKVSVAERDERPVGISVLDLAEPPELAALFVEPDVIGTGVGRALLAHELERARAAGVDSVLIESDPNAEPFLPSPRSRTDRGEDIADHRTPADAATPAGAQGSRAAVQLSALIRHNDSAR